MTKWIKMFICWFSHSVGLAFTVVLIVQSIRGGMDRLGLILCMTLCAVVQIWVDPRPKSWMDKEENAS